MGGIKKLSCSTKSSNTAVCCASPSFAISGGATMGMMTKIISNASSTQAHSATPSNTSAAVASGDRVEASTAPAIQRSVPSSRNTRLKVLAPTSSANSAPLKASVSASTLRNPPQLRARVASATVISSTPPVAAASTAKSWPVNTPPNSSRITLDTTINIASCACLTGATGTFLWFFRPCQPASSAHSSKTDRAGSRAALKTSRVLMMRCAPSTKPGRLLASRCARSMASPSKISTSDGGTTTPMVAATLISAVARAASSWPRRGATRRDSRAELDATEPFIGAISAPTPRAASASRAPVRRNRWDSDENIASATVRRCSSTPTSTYSGRACSKSCSSRPTMRAGNTASTFKSITPAARPSAANRLAVPMSKAHTGRPVATISTPRASSIHRPVVPAMPDRPDVGPIAFMKGGGVWARQAFWPAGLAWAAGATARPAAPAPTSGPAPA